MKAKFQEILKLLDLQKQSLTELAVELVSPSQLVAVNARLNAQKAIVLRAKIEQKVRESSILQ